METDEAKKQRWGAYEACRTKHSKLQPSNIGSRLDPLNETSKFVSDSGDLDFVEREVTRGELRVSMSIWVGMAVVGICMGVNVRTSRKRWDILIHGVSWRRSRMSMRNRAWDGLWRRSIVLRCGLSLGCIAVISIFPIDSKVIGSL